MKSMASLSIRTTRRLIPALLFATTVSALWAEIPASAPPEPQDLVGFWESREVSKGGIGHTFQFLPSGTFAEATTVMVEFRYEISGDRLIVTSASPQDPGPPEESTVRIDGDHLIQTTKDSGPVPVEKVRVGKAEEGAPPIVGVWRFSGSMANLTVHFNERYTRDGRMSLRIVLRSSSGRYKIEGDHLTLSKPVGKNITTFRFRQSLGDLTLESAAGGRFTYSRPEAGAWYDLKAASRP